MTCCGADFTINAMALRLPSLELVDPFGGVRDLHASILATPGAAGNLLLR